MDGLTPWHAEVQAGDLREVAEWSGMARSAAHAAAIAVGLTSAAWKIRAGERSPRRLSATANPSLASGSIAPTLTLWHDAMLAGPAEAPGQPREATLARAAYALLRLAAPGLGAGAHGALAASLNMQSSTRGPRGEVLCEKHLAGLTLTAERRPAPVTVGDALATAVAALSLASRQSLPHERALELHASATLRAAQAAELARSRAADIKTVVRFLQRLGLRDEAKALALALAA